MYCSYSLGLFAVVLLQLQQHISAQTISLSKTEFKFDEPIEVSWDYSGYDPDITYISIFHKNVPDDQDEAMYGYICSGTQSDGADDCDPSVSSGTMVFYATDPELEYDQQWPINPGNYRACLRHESNINIECKEFKIKGIPADVEEYTAINPMKRKFDYGETLSARFYMPRLYTNAWIGIYFSDQEDKNHYYKASHRSSTINEPLMWVYTGCDNQAGDQEDTNDCSTKRRKGMIHIDEHAEEESRKYFHEITPGEYRFCLSYLNNQPYTRVKCSDKFVVV